MHRRLLLAGLALPNLAQPILARAQQPPAGYPSHPIRLIVPWGPGAFTDAGARLVAGKIREAWGQPVVVDNRPGANGMIGSGAAARAAADGYTLVVATADTHSINPTLYRNVPYDAARDFVPVHPIAAMPLVLVVHPSQPARSLAEFVALAKAQPGRLRYGSWGEGSTAHLTMELLKTMAGLDLLHVPYRGAAQLQTDVIAGHVDCAFTSVPLAFGAQREGHLRVLALSSPARFPAQPETPTVAESYPGFEAQLWYGVMAPAGTPPAIVEALNAVIRAGLDAPDTRQRLAASSLTPMLATTAEFGAFVRAQLAGWTRIVRNAGVQLD